MLVISKSMSKKWDQDDYKSKQAHVELARRCTSATLRQLRSLGIAFRT